VRLVSPIGGAAGGSGNLSTSLSNVARLAAHPKFVWVFNANCDGTITYNDCIKQQDSINLAEIRIFFSSFPFHPKFFMLDKDTLLLWGL
jgi:hypothetical protein